MRDTPVGVRWDPNITTTPVRDWSLVSYRINLDKPASELQAYVKGSATTTNGHEHTYTCKKGKVGRRGDNIDCRLDLPLPLVPETCLVSDASFAVRRDHGMLPAFVPALMLAYPANHVIQFCCEVTRFLRHHLLWQDASKIAGHKVGRRRTSIFHRRCNPRPVLPPPIRYVSHASPAMTWTISLHRRNRNAF
jgi:hypothetical protein